MLMTFPDGNHLWCIGGEFFSEDGRAVRNFKFTTDHGTRISNMTSSIFNNDIFRYWMNGRSSFRLRVQARGLPMLSFTSPV